MRFATRIVLVADVLVWSLLLALTTLDWSIRIIFVGHEFFFLSRGLAAVLGVAVSIGLIFWMRQVAHYLPVFLLGSLMFLLILFSTVVWYREIVFAPLFALLFMNG